MNKNENALKRRYINPSADGNALNLLASMEMFFLKLTFGESYILDVTTDFSEYNNKKL